LPLTDEETAIAEARLWGITGGGAYDSLRATFARRKGTQCIVTRSLSHFSPTAPEMEILTPGPAAATRPSIQKRPQRL